MLDLAKGSVNSNIFLDVTDGGTNQYSYYLFVFSKNGIDYPVICTDLSTTAQRVSNSKFTITEGSSDPTNGSLIIGSSGVYQLNIYGQSSPTNLLPASATEQLIYLPTRWNGNDTAGWIENEIDITFIEHTI